MRTAGEVDAEIAALKEIKPKVIRRSFFGDDHHAAIDAQVRVLHYNMSERTIEEEYGGEESSQNVMDEALNARLWLDGEYEEASLVDSWKELVL